MNGNKKKRPLIIIVLISLLLLPLFLRSQQYSDLPRPNCFVKGTPRSNLVVVKEIVPDFDKDLFFAVPWTMAVSKLGYIYLYDIKMFRVFIFGPNYQYIGQCLTRGMGPGESPGPGNKELHVSANQNLLIHDGLTDRIICFSQNGKYLKEARLNRPTKTKKPSIPVVDMDGNLYLFSQGNSIVDKYDKDLKLVKSYLDINLNDRFVFYRPAFEDRYTQPKLRGLKNLKLWLIPTTFNTFFDVTPDNQLFIFLYRSGTAFFFKKDQLSNQFEILIDRVLNKHKEKVIAMNKEQKEKKNGNPFGAERAMFMSCFLDFDDPNYFYLQGNFEDPEYSLYRFDRKGKLNRVFSNYQHQVIFKGKSNGVFQGLSMKDFHPVVLKQN